MKVLFASVLALLLVVALCVSTATISATATTNSKLLMALPNSLNKDKSIIELPPKVGLPFGDFSSKTPAELKNMLVAEFPLLMTNSSKKLVGGSFSSKSADAQKTLQVEAIRFAILENALKFRKLNAGDDTLLRVMSGGWECEACTWSVNELEGFLSSHGCSDASDYIGKLCARIPYVGPFTVPECQKVLDWGCEKLWNLIKQHIDSPSQLCDDVFGLHC